MWRRCWGLCRGYAMAGSPKVMPVRSVPGEMQVSTDTLKKYSNVEGHNEARASMGCETARQTDCVGLSFWRLSRTCG